MGDARMKCLVLAPQRLGIRELPPSEIGDREPTDETLRTLKERVIEIWRWGIS